MSKRNPTLLIQDILEAIEKVQIYTQNMDYDTFLSDMLLLGILKL